MVGYIAGSTLFTSGPGYPCHSLLFEQFHYPHFRWVIQQRTRIGFRADLLEYALAIGNNPEY